MARFRYRAQCVKGNDCTAAERKSRKRSPAEDEENGKHFGTEGEEAPRVQRVGSVEREGPSGEVIPGSNLYFVETALQLANRRRQKEVKNIIRPISDAKFNVAELRQHVKEVDDHKRILSDSRGEKLAEEVSIKKRLKSGSGSSVSGAELYRKDAFAVLRKQMATGSSQDVLFWIARCSGRHGACCWYSGTLHGHKTQRRMRERFLASRSSDVWWDSEANQLPRLISGLIRIFSDKAATEQKFNATVPYPFHVV